MKFKEVKNLLEEKVGIYCIKNTITKKCYIGSCISFKDRLSRHYYYLKNNKHHSKKNYKIHGINMEKMFLKLK